jgi:hypothetical protein
VVAPDHGVGGGLPAHGSGKCAVVRVPVEGKAIWFAPCGNNQEPSASIWKVWAQGSEVYASSRPPRTTAKISVHESGQIHYKLGKELKRGLAPLMQMGSGPWSHAFELRFLTSDVTFLPSEQRKSLKNKSASLISVPDGFFLCANLIIGSTGTPLDYGLPAELASGQTLWRTSLRNGRPAVLIVRGLKLDEQDRRIKEQYKLQSRDLQTFTSSAHEFYHLHSSSQVGNVILVMAFLPGV